MAQCKWCEQKGFFLSVNADGLCSSCQPMIALAVEQYGRIINDCMKLIANSKNMKTRLARCDLLVERAQLLLQYEHKGIPTISPTPSELLKLYAPMRDDILLQGTTGDVEKALAKAEVAATPRTAITEATKALVKVREAKQQLQEKEKLNELEGRVNRFLHETQLNAYLEAARKAEFKGQRKKALDQYQEALYFLQTDEIEDSLQAEKIGEIKSKISELSD